MKALFIVTLVLFFGISAMANDTIDHVKVQPIKMGLVLDLGNSDLKVEGTSGKKDGETKIARLYRRKNSRIKKALSFTTKKSRPKMA